MRAQARVKDHVVADAYWGRYLVITASPTTTFGSSETRKLSNAIMVLPAPTQEIVPPLWEPPWRSTLFGSPSLLYLEPEEIRDN